MNTITYSTSAHWQPKLNGEGIVEGVDDVNQCIHVICTTPKGSVPHRPDFGNGAYDYLDGDPVVAMPHVIRETIDAVVTWEPRVTSVSASILVANEVGKLKVQYKLADGVLREVEVHL